VIICYKLKEKLQTNPHLLCNTRQLQTAAARLLPSTSSAVNWIIWEIIATFYFSLCIYFSEKFPVAVCGCGAGEEEYKESPSLSLKHYNGSSRASH